jgi:hypothetical protein
MKREITCRPLGMPRAVDFDQASSGARGGHKLLSTLLDLWGTIQAVEISAR